MEPKVNKISELNHVTIEDALDKTGFGKFNYALIFLAGGILGCVFLETVSINFILPVAQCDLSLSNQDKGILSGISFIGIIASSHLWGFLADTRGRKKVIVPTLLIAFVLTIISSFVKSFKLLVLLRFMNGIFISGPSATIYAYLGEFHSMSRRSRVMMLGSTTYAVFCFLNPIFASIIINQDWSFYIETLDLVFKPWRLFMIICGCPSLICGLIMMFFMPESPKFLFSQGDEVATMRVLKIVHRINNGRSKQFDVTSIVKDENYQESSTNTKSFFNFMWSQTAPLFRSPHLRNILTVCFVQFCLFNTSNGFWTFFPEITNRIALWTESNPSHVSSTVCHILDATSAVKTVNNGTFVDTSVCITKLNSSSFKNVFILQIFYFFGWLLFALIINRVGKLIIITSLLFTCSGCAVALIFVTNPSASSYLYIILLTAGLAFTVLNVSTVELFPTRLRAMALSLSLMCGRLGAFAGTNIIGFLLDDHCEYTFLMPAVLLSASGVLAFTIPRISERIRK